MPTSTPMFRWLSSGLSDRTSSHCQSALHGIHSLSLSLYGERYAGRADPAGQALLFSNLTGTLGRYAQRWHTVDIRIPEESYDSHDFLHPLQDCHFRILTSFSLHDLESRKVGMLEMLYTMFRHAPLLPEIR